MNVPVRALLLICGSLLCFGVGEYNSKLYALQPAYWRAAVVVLCYAVGSSFWLPAIRLVNQLTVLGTLWNIGAMLVTVAIGMIVFRETVTPSQSVGVVLALISCYLLSHYALPCPFVLRPKAAVWGTGPRLSLRCDQYHQRIP